MYYPYLCLHHHSQYLFHIILYQHHHLTNNSNNYDNKILLYHILIIYQKKCHHLHHGKLILKHLNVHYVLKNLHFGFEDIIVGKYIYFFSFFSLKINFLLSFLIGITRFSFYNNNNIFFLLDGVALYFVPHVLPPEFLYPLKMNH